MGRELHFQTWLDPIQGVGSRGALSSLPSPSDAIPGEVIGHYLDVELTREGRLAEVPRQWFCLGTEVGLGLVSFDALPENQKPRAAIAASYLLEDALFEDWIKDRLGEHMKAHGRDEASYGIFSIAGAVLAVHEDALSTMSLDLSGLCDTGVSKEVLGAISRDLSHHARIETLHQIDILFTRYHMTETPPGDPLSVFLGDIRVRPSLPKPLDSVNLRQS